MRRALRAALVVLFTIVFALPAGAAARRHWGKPAHKAVAARAHGKRAPQAAHVGKAHKSWGKAHAPARPAAKAPARHAPRPKAKK